MIRFNTQIFLQKVVQYEIISIYMIKCAVHLYGTTNMQHCTHRTCLLIRMASTTTK